MSKPKPVNTITLTGDEIDTLATAMDMRSNFVQTGDPFLSNEDLAARKDPKRPPRVPTITQMKAIIAYHELAERLRAARHPDS